MFQFLKVLNAYIHDFASAMWLATVLTIYWIGRFSPPKGSEEFLYTLKKEFFYISIVCLIIILVTGVGRTILYQSGQLGEDAEKKRRFILIVKHILGLVIYGTGTYWQYYMVFA